ncbi:MAG: hypothetical protein ACXW3Y_09080, partial [Rhodoplanes sp.]
WAGEIQFGFRCAHFGLRFLCSSPPGLTRRSMLNCRTLGKATWIAGSSPAMTKEAVAGSSRQGTKKTVGQIRQ